MASEADYSSLEAPLAHDAENCTSEASPGSNRRVVVALLVAFGFTAFLGVSMSSKSFVKTTDLPKLEEKTMVRPLVHGSYSELPGFKEFYMKKHNMKNMTKVGLTNLAGNSICKKTTSMDSVYSEGSIFYHGTLVDFSGYPFSPSWFAAELPPANKLAMHVPMAWMCFGKGGYTLPGKYWLKTFKIKAQEDLPREVNAEKFYDDLSNQAGEAKDWCSCQTSRMGFQIDADAVDEIPEYVMCDPERDMEYITQYVGHSSMEDGSSTLILDVGSFGKYSLDCTDPMGSFEVIEPPSMQAEIPDSPKSDPDCCGCCVEEDGTCEIGDQCADSLTGDLKVCSYAGKTYPDDSYGCDLGY